MKIVKLDVLDKGCFKLIIRLEAVAKCYRNTNHLSWKRKMILLEEWFEKELETQSSHRRRSLAFVNRNNCTRKMADKYLRGHYGNEYHGRGSFQ